MTASILFAVIAVLAVGEVRLFGALAEAYRDIRQIREHANVIDKSTPVDLGQAYNQVPSGSAYIQIWILLLAPWLSTSISAVARAG